MRKTLLWIIVIVALVGGAAYFLFLNLNWVVKTAIEKYGSEAAGTRVALESVDISIESGRGVIKGLTIANPKGYSPDAAVRVATVSFEIDTKSIIGDGPIVIKSVSVDEPYVVYEGSGMSSNLQAIDKNVKKYASKQSASSKSDRPGQTTAKKGERKLIIEDLTIDNGHVSVSHSALKGEELSTDLPQIHLTNIGKSTNGATYGEVAHQLLDALMDAATRAAVKALVGKVGPIAGLPAIIGEVGQSAGDALDNLLGR